MREQTRVGTAASAVPPSAERRLQPDLANRLHGLRSAPPCSIPYIVSMPKPSRRKALKAKVLSSREVYRGPVFRVTVDEVIEPSGIRARRDIVRHPGSVVILALDDSRSRPRLLLERQYRHAAESY